MSLEAGERFTAEVTYVTQSGKGTVKHGHDTINIGPVDCEKGRRVRLKFLGEQNDSIFALCLTEEVHGEGYHDYIRNIIDEIIPDRPPAVGEETYVEIDKIEERNLGISILGGKHVQLGPVRANEGDLVRVIGAPHNCAEVLTESARGENYEVRFNLISKQYDKLPVEEGDEFQTTIADKDGDDLVGYVGNVPVYFPSGSAELAQKIDACVTSFDHDRVRGEVLKTYDEVGRIKNANHWARMRWLKDVGFDNDPLHDFTQSFLGAGADQLPSDDSQLRDTLIAEAIRLAIADKTKNSDDEYPRAHISGIRHWVVHKLSAVLGEPGEAQEDGKDWFKGVLSDRVGPTITFLGDVLQLSEGYYAPAPTRAVMTSETEAVLLSGQPSSVFLESSLDLEFRGISRIITNTSEDTLEDAGIHVQPRRSYVGLDETTLLTEADLKSYIATQPRETWSGDDSWEAYTGQEYGFQLDSEPLTVDLDDGTEVSFWRVPVEYGTDAYRLQVRSAVDDTQSDGDDKMVAVPPRYRKHVCLILDAMSGLPQGVELSRFDDDVVVNCDFAPPRPQMRWLHAIGAEWLETSSRQLQWRIDGADATSVREVFSELPVAVTDNATGET